jgi:hypothetical protein
MLALEVPVVAVSHDESSYYSRCPEISRDVVTGNHIRLSVGWEGEDGNPSGEDISERVHLNETISSRLARGRKRRHQPRQRYTPAFPDHVCSLRSPRSK